MNTPIARTEAGASEVISIEIRSAVAALSCLKVRGRRPFVEETLTNF